MLNFHSGGQIGEIISKKSGWAGVDAFFVISGFLITGILLKEQTKTATIALKNFYARRALRLVPAYVLFLIVTALFNPKQCTQLAPAIGVAAMYMCDFDLALNWGHILGSGLEITWSLSVEEKFYLIWPTVMKHLRKPFSVDRRRDNRCLLRLESIPALYRRLLDAYRRRIRHKNRRIDDRLPGSDRPAQPSRPSLFAKALHPFPGSYRTVRVRHVLPSWDGAPVWCSIATR